MNDAEKIEELREWAKQGVPDDWPDYWRGYFAAAKMVRDIIDTPKPKWREMVEVAFDKPYETCARDPLVEVLRCLTFLQDVAPESIQLARIVAVAEAQVGDGWEADPDSTAYGCAEQDVYDVFILLDPLANLTEPLCWKRVGDRAAAWLRSLTDGGAA